MDLSTPLQVCRDCGGGAPVDVHFCPQCSRILTLGRQGDYFSFLGVPRKLNLDGADLDQRFRSLSRQFHPDYFYNASPAERRASLERASYLNDAYRTLKQPVARIEYLLEREGFGAASSGHVASGGLGERGGASPNDARVPAVLLEEVFALNEELDEIRVLRERGAPSSDWRARLDRAKAPIEAKRANHEAQLQALAAEWDALVDASGPDEARRPILQTLRERMLERNYISNLLATIDREMSLEPGT